MSEELEDVAADIDAEVQEDTNISEDSNQEDTVDLAEELEKQRKANSQIVARAKRAEEELKKFKSQSVQPPITNNPELPDELKLIARGLTDEEIDKAKVIAKGMGIALQEAIKDPMFVIFQNDLKEKQKKENAKLGASKGSGQTEEKVSGVQSGSTREEHIKAFKEVMGK